MQTSRRRFRYGEDPADSAPEVLAGRVAQTGPEASAALVVLTVLQMAPALAVLLTDLAQVDLVAQTDPEAECAAGRWGRECECLRSR